MRTLSLAMLLLLGISSTTASGQDADAAMKQHVTWGGFEPGSSVTVREVSTEPGVVEPTAITETTTTLLETHDDYIVLEVQTQLEAAGKEFAPPPSRVKEDLFGRPIGEHGAVEELPSETLRIGLQRIRCQVRKTRVESPAGIMDETIYYNAALAPYIFKRVTTMLAPDGEKLLHETTRTVKSFRAGRALLGFLPSGYREQIVERTASTTVHTEQLCSCEFPGGVYWRQSFEYDGDGKLVRTTRLEMKDCELQFAPEPTPTAVNRFHLFSHPLQRVRIERTAEEAATPRR